MELDTRDTLGSLTARPNQTASAALGDRLQGQGFNLLLHRSLSSEHIAHSRPSLHLRGLDYPSAGPGRFWLGRVRAGAACAASRRVNLEGP